MSDYVPPVVKQTTVSTSAPVMDEPRALTVDEQMLDDFLCHFIRRRFIFYVSRDVLTGAYICAEVYDGRRFVASLHRAENC